MRCFEIIEKHRYSPTMVCALMINPPLLVYLNNRRPYPLMMPGWEVERERLGITGPEFDPRTQNNKTHIQKSEHTEKHDRYGNESRT